MKNFSNTYIFVFSLVMVTIVAILLSFVSMQLQPIQAMNLEIEKKQSILKSVGKAKNVDNVPDKKAYINEQYGKFITDSYVVDYQGEKVDADAFGVLLKMSEEVAKPLEERQFPLFIYQDDQGNKMYVVPVRGKGLWGPIWGYIALKSDLNTINGAVFDHQNETPGLGAEIATDQFQAEFVGKTIYNKEGKFVSIDVVKGGADPSDPHGVDAVSGGTITSKGLQAMLKDCLSGYINYFKKLKAQ